MSDFDSAENLIDASQVEAHIVVRATGFQREDWFRLLDARNGQAMTPDEVVTWLQNNTKLDEWWSNSIGQAYVQARGIGQLTQTSTGLFATSVSRDFAVELPRLFTVMVDLEAWPAQPQARMILRKENERFQVVFEDASRAMLTFVEHQPGYVTVVVSHELLESQRDAELVEGFWTRLLGKVAERLGV